jgi:anti-sigma factor (TIGR02949 family)
MTCDEVIERLDDYLDRELAFPDMALVRKHLGSCPECSTELTQRARLLDAIRHRLRQVTPPSDLMVKLAATLAAGAIERRRFSH